VSSRILELACFPRTRASRPCTVRHPRWRPRTLALRARFERHACRAPLSSSTGKARRYQKTRTRWVAHASATVSGDAIQKAAARLAAHGAPAAASWWASADGAACSGQWAQRVGDQLVAEPDVWLQHRPHSVRGAGQQMAPGQCIASHGRLTACLSRLMRYPDRADDRRASLFLRRGILCMLACVVKGS
jgi:hypothetical protein